MQKQPLFAQETASFEGQNNLFETFNGFYMKAYFHFFLIEKYLQ